MSARATHLLRLVQSACEGDGRNKGIVLDGLSSLVGIAAVGGDKAKESILMCLPCLREGLTLLANQEEEEKNVASASQEEGATEAGKALLKEGELVEMEDIYAQSLLLMAQIVEGADTFTPQHFVHLVAALRGSD